MINLEGYAAAATGVIAGMVPVFAGVMTGDIIGGLFSGLCFFVFGMAAFSKALDAIETRKAIEAWEKHHRRNIDFRVGRPVKGWPGYVEIDA